MRALTTAAASAAARSTAEPIYLMQIDFAVPEAYTLRLSDAWRRALGEEWLPLVQSWGTLEEVLDGLDAGGAPATAFVTLFNTKPVAGRSRLSDLLRSPLNTTGAYEFAYAKVTVYRLDAEITTGDEVTLNVFYLEEPLNIGEDLLELRMSDITLVLEHRLLLTRITRELFPTAAPEALNRFVPRPFGRLTDVPALPIEDGARGDLAADITAGVTSLTLEDASDFDVSGTIQVRAEQMVYTRTGNVFTVTRAQNSTTASEHPAGTPVLQLRPRYRFAIGEVVEGFPLQAVSSVKVDGALARTSPVVSEEVVNGKRLALITFTPADVKTFHVLASGEGWSVAVTALTVVCDGAQFLYQTRTIPIPSGAEIGPRTVRAMAYTLTGSTGLSGARVYRRLAGSGATGTGALIAELGAQASGWSYSGSDSRTYESTTDEVVELGAHVAAGAGATVTLTFISYTVAADPGSGRSTAGRLIGDVTCNVDGVEDDAAGSITGLPGLLLENPADVTAFILTRLYPGVAAGDLGARFAAARASLGAAGLKWAVLLGQDGIVRFSDLRRLVGEQARAELFVEAGHFQLRYLADDPIADVTLDYTRDLWEQAPARVARTERTRVFNSIAATTASGYTALAEDLAYPELGRPTNERQQTALALPWVRDAATADALAAFWLRQWKRQRFLVDLVAWQNALAIEKGDHLAIASHPILETHGGAALVFRVVSKRYLLDDDNPARIRLTAIEANT